MGFNDEMPTIISTNESHMACLFLLDTSGSMINGDAITSLNAIRNVMVGKIRIIRYRISLMIFL